MRATKVSSIEQSSCEDHMSYCNGRHPNSCLDFFFVANFEYNLEVMRFELPNRLSVAGFFPWNH